MQQEKINEFLEELNKLSQKYNLYLVGGYTNIGTGEFDGMRPSINLSDDRFTTIERDIYYNFGYHKYYLES